MLKKYDVLAVCDKEKTIAWESFHEKFLNTYLHGIGIVCLRQTKRCYLNRHGQGQRVNQ